MKYNVVTVARTDWEPATKNAYCFLGGVARACSLRGFNTSDIYRQHFVRSTVESTIHTKDPSFFVACGHGNETTLAGHFNEPVFVSCSNDHLLATRVVHLLSCLTAKTLGKTIIGKGGAAFIGYSEEFVFLNVSGVAVEDKYAWGFMFADTMNGNTPLICGGTVRDAYNLIKSSFDKYIEWWSTQEDDPYASEVIKWMIWDRDCLQLYGDPDVRITNKPYIPFPTDIVTPDKSNHFRLIVRVLSPSNTPLQNVSVEVKIGETTISKNTDENGCVILEVPNQDITVSIPGLTSWEDGSKDNPRTISAYPSMYAGDIILVAYVGEVIGQVLYSSVNFFILLFIIVLIRACIRILKQKTI